MSHVEVVEVGPRDGLQNEPEIVSTVQKLEYAAALIAAGVRRIEVTSFVSPARVPQLADADAVVAGLRSRSDVRLSALVLNQRGAERAVAAGVDEINCLVLTTDEFSRRNQGVDTAGAIQTFHRIAETARAHGLGVTLTIGASFGCPFTGEVGENRVAQVVEACRDTPVDELSLADTIGVATPGAITRVFGMLRAEHPDLKLRCHLHNTRNTGYANAYAAIAAGVTVLDASTGGIGGCPFAPGASGNIATEDLAWALHRDGIETGLDVAGLIAAAGVVEAALGRQVPAQQGRAPAFP